MMYLFDEHKDLGALEKYFDFNALRKLLDEHGKLRIIFLDIDGVLNSNRYYTSKEGDIENRQQDEFGDSFCSISAGYLNKLIEETGAFVIISSTWRFMTRNGMSYLETMQDMWTKRKMSGSVIGITPSFDISQRKQNMPHIPSAPRGVEIQYIYETIFGFNHWYWDSPAVQRAKEKCLLDTYVIIDDDRDMLYSQRKNFVNCNFMYGFMESEYKKAKQILTTQHDR